MRTLLFFAINDQIISGRYCPPGSHVCRHKRALGFQQSAASKEAGFPHRLEDEIEDLADAGEILCGIVDGAVRAEGFDQLQMTRGDDRGHLGAIGFRKLHSRQADGAGGAVDQDFVARPDVEFSQPRVGVESALADHRFLEVRVCRHDSDWRSFGDADIFRLSAIAPRRAHAEDAIARLERHDFGTHAFNHAGEIHPENCAPRPAQPEEEPPDDAGSELTAIRPVDRRRMDPDQNFVRCGRRFRRIEYLYHVR